MSKPVSRGARPAPCDGAPDREGLAALSEAESTLAIEARDRLISEAAHDLRSPLNGIQGWAHVLESRVGEDASPILRKALDGIKNGIQQQVELITDLADMRAILAGTLPLDMSTVQGATLLPSALERAAAAARARKVALVDGGNLGETVMLQADSARLSRAFQAVLAHVLRSAMEGSQLVVRAELRDGEAWWHVGEPGLGSARAGLASGKARVPASLRLADCLLCLHGGSVQHVPLEAEDLPCGYRIRLPLAAAPGEQARELAAARASMPGSSLRVGLVAEGDDGERMRESLRDLGMEPLPCSPQQAAGASELDLVFMPATAAQVRAAVPRVLYAQAGGDGVLDVQAGPRCTAAHLRAALAAAPASN